MRAQGTFHDLGLLNVTGFGRRRVRVYVPARADVHTVAEAPALYLLDGQNVFGDEGSFAGGWNAHLAVERLSPRVHRVPLIVALANGEQKRMDEMAAWADPAHGGHGGRAADFVDWIADVLVPRITRDFGVQPGAEGAVIGGSSMGGLASLYAHHRRPESFGGALCMSSSLFWANKRIFSYVEKRRVPKRSRIYLDCGAKEASGRMAGWMDEMADLLARRGYERDRLMVRLDPRGLHHEKHWGRRLPPALRFLFQR